MKSIAVIGNAVSVGRKNYISTIDSMDIVCRFNHGNYDLRSSCLGTRLDYAIFSDPYFWDFSKITSKIVLQKKKINTTKKQFNNNLRNVIWIPESNAIEIINLLEVERPSMGAYILHCLSNTEHDVHIFGFDWMKTPSFGRGGGSRAHDFKREEQYFSELIQDKNWTIH